MNPTGLTFQIGIIGRKLFPSITKLLPGTIRPLIKGVPAKNGGIRVDLGWGKLRCPIPKIWKWQMYVHDYMTRESNTNPWNSNNYWFVLTIPIFPIIYLFIAYGPGDKQYGFYVGIKSYHIEQRWDKTVLECQLKEYKADKNDKFIFDADDKPVLTWCKKSDIGQRYLTLTASLRADMVE